MKSTPQVPLPCSLSQPFLNQYSTSSHSLLINTKYFSFHTTHRFISHHSKAHFSAYGTVNMTYKSSSLPIPYTLSSLSDAQPYIALFRTSQQDISSYSYTLEPHLLILLSYYPITHSLTHSQTANCCSRCSTNYYPRNPLLGALYANQNTRTTINQTNLPTTHHIPHEPITTPENFSKAHGKHQTCKQQASNEVTVRLIIINYALEMIRVDDICICYIQTIDDSFILPQSVHPCPSLFQIPIFFPLWLFAFPSPSMLLPNFISPHQKIRL